MTFPARTAVAVGAKVSMWPIRLLKIGSVRGEMDKGGSGNKKKPKGLNAGNNRRFGFAGFRLCGLGLSVKRKELRRRLPKGNLRGAVKLFDFDFGTSSFELLLDLFGFFFLGTFLERLWSALDKLLGFCQAKSGNHATNLFDDGDLIATSISKDDVKFRFLFSRRSSSSSRSGSSNGYRSGSANAPLVFKGFDEFSDLKNGQAAQVFNEFCNISHVILCRYRRFPELRMI